MTGLRKENERYVCDPGFGQTGIEREMDTRCGEGRIPGAAHFACVWVISAQAEKPADTRIKDGKYIGFSEKYQKKKTIRRAET